MLATIPSFFKLFSEIKTFSRFLGRHFQASLFFGNGGTLKNSLEKMLIALGFSSFYMLNNRMSKNILLINPWIYDFAAYDYWLKPLGLLYLGGLLRACGQKISYIDCLNPYSSPMLERKGKLPKRHPFGHGRFFRQVIEKPACLDFFPRSFSRYGIEPDILRQQLRQNADADLVLVGSMMTYWYAGVFDVIKIVKETLPGRPVVMGGKYASLCGEHAAAFSGADYVISGPGETPILNLLKNLFKENITSPYNENNLDSLPYPAFDLSDSIDQIPLITSLGCPYRCSYCSAPLFYKKYLRRNPLLVADEIEHWQKEFGVTDFSFYDDALLVNAENHLMLLLAEIKKRKLSCRFHCPNGLHLRNIHAHLSQMLYDSCFKTIRFGFETANFQQQQETGGKVQNEELRQAVRHLKNAGYQTADIGIYLLCGIPGQKTADVAHSIEFVQECGARPVLAEYSPIPGTKMWSDAVASSPFDIQHEPLYHNNSLLCCRNEDFTYEAYRALKAKLK